MCPNKNCRKEFNSPESVYLHQIETDHFDQKERIIEEFKEGDNVLLNKDCTWSEQHKFCKLAYSKDNLIAFDREEAICASPDHWQLISPKEKTIEEVQVGDVLVKEGSFNLTVELVSGNIVIVSVSIYHGNISTINYHIKQLEKDGWKIKQPEPEKKEWQQIFLEAGTKELGIDCSPLIKTVSDILSSK